MNKFTPCIPALLACLLIHVGLSMPGAAVSATPGAAGLETAPIHTWHRSSESIGSIANGAAGAADLAHAILAQMYQQGVGGNPRTEKIKRRDEGNSVTLTLPRATWMMHDSQVVVTWFDGVTGPENHPKAQLFSWQTRNLAVQEDKIVRLRDREQLELSFRVEPAPDGYACFISRSEKEDVRNDGWLNTAEIDWLFGKNFCIRVQARITHKSFHMPKATLDSVDFRSKVMTISEQLMKSVALAAAEKGLITKGGLDRGSAWWTGRVEINRLTLPGVPDRSDIARAAEAAGEIAAFMAGLFDPPGRVEKKAAAHGNSSYSLVFPGSRVRGYCEILAFPEREESFHPEHVDIHRERDLPEKFSFMPFPMIEGRIEGTWKPKAAATDGGSWPGQARARLEIRSDGTGFVIVSWFFGPSYRYHFTASLFSITPDAVASGPGKEMLPALKRLGDAIADGAAGIMAGMAGKNPGPPLQDRTWQRDENQIAPQLDAVRKLTPEEISALAETLQASDDLPVCLSGAVLDSGISTLEIPGGTSSQAAEAAIAKRNAQVEETLALMTYALLAPDFVYTAERGGGPGRVSFRIHILRDNAFLVLETEGSTKVFPPEDRKGIAGRIARLCRVPDDVPKGIGSESSAGASRSLLLDPEIVLMLKAFVHGRAGLESLLGDFAEPCDGFSAEQFMRILCDGSFQEAMGSLPEGPRQTMQQMSVNGFSASMALRLAMEDGYLSRRIVKSRLFYFLSPLGKKLAAMIFEPANYLRLKSIGLPEVRDGISGGQRKKEGPVARFRCRNGVATMSWGPDGCLLQAVHPDGRLEMIFTGSGGSESLDFMMLHFL